MQPDIVCSLLSLTLLGAEQNLYPFLCLHCDIFRMCLLQVQ